MPFIQKLQCKASLLECKFWDQEILAYIQSLSPIWASQVVLVVKNQVDVRDTGLIPGLGGSPGAGHDNLLQYSCLENPIGP